MKPLLYALFGHTALLHSLCEVLDAELGSVHCHTFPDGETSLRFEEDLTDRSVLFLEDLANPNSKTLPLIFAAHTAKTLGAAKVGLCTPYLPYMRQDTQFHPGESVTSITYAKLLSQFFDWLVTVDPHLHRYHDLDEIYTLETHVVHAAESIAKWIRDQIAEPLLIGPDVESTQWVADIAQRVGAPYQILKKTRGGDRDVKISLSSTERFGNHTLVIIDDIIASAFTLIETIRTLKAQTTQPVISIGVHGIFAGNAYQALLATGVDRIVTCNSIVHETNRIDLTGCLAEGIKRYV